MHQLQLFPQYGKIYVVQKLSTRMKYTVKDLRRDFPDDQSCLERLVQYLYPNGITCKKCQVVTKHHKLKNRKVYSCDKCGTQVSPTAGTIFHKSSVPLTDWFYAIWIMSSNKAGTSAKQIERELGVSYPTAWRMMHQIRKMMDAPDELLSGEVEVDETFVHANSFKNSRARRRYGFDARRTGQVVFGMVQRGGPVKVWHVKTDGARILQPLIRDNIQYGTLIHSDGHRAYQRLPKMGYEHRWTDHGKFQFYTPDSAIQNIENVWSHFKRGIKGVYRHIGPAYVQAYANEFAWRYSNRNATSMFWALMERVSSERLS
jgi:transposase-like protein